MAYSSLSILVSQGNATATIVITLPTAGTIGSPGKGITDATADVLSFAQNVSKKGFWSGGAFYPPAAILKITRQ